MSNHIISMQTSGNFKKTEGFLHRIIQRRYERKLNFYGEMGVRLLSEATPRDTGKTAESWSYEIVQKEDSTAIYWKNSNTNRTIPIAILLQYGHGTRNGGFVEGIDYINPALHALFLKMADEAWKEVVE